MKIFTEKQDISKFLLKSSTKLRKKHDMAILLESELDDFDDILSSFEISHQNFNEEMII